MLTSKQRAALRAAANTLDPVFQVGKGEIDEMLIKSTADCLAARELIKMKVLETSMYNAKEAAAILAEATGADVVQVIGSKFVLFLKKKKESKFEDILKAARRAAAKRPEKQIVYNLFVTFLKYLPGKPRCLNAWPGRMGEWCNETAVVRGHL